MNSPALDNAPKILVAGAAGYMGRRLKTRLLNEKKVHLRLLVRDARQMSVSTRSAAEIVEGDILNREVVRKAVDGIGVVYFPIRFFGAVWESEGFDGAAVRMFRDTCIEAGVRRLIYVSLNVVENDSIGLLKSVVETGRILSERPEEIQTVWFRAGVLVGSGSVMFELVRNVVQKIPLILCSRWMDEVMTPVSVDDVLEYLVQAKDIQVEGNLTVDVGSEQMSFREMLKAATRIMGLQRVFVTLPLSARRLSSFLLMLASPFSFALSSALIRALQSGEIRPSSSADGTAALHYFPGIIPVAFDKAMEKAMTEIENDYVMSRWVDTLEKTFYVSSEEDVARAVFRDMKCMSFGDVPSHRIFRAIKSIGGRKGWFTFDFLWRIRGLLDKLGGGYGTAMGKRSFSDLRVGDMLDVWRVIDLRENRRLLLEAQMKVFGKAWLEFTIEGNTLTQVAYHYPKGILGRLYWYAMLPFHVFIFRDMIRSIIQRAHEMD
ncbi:MAG: SDR family oxidoreductase [Chloroflexota bacterium]